MDITDYKNYHFSSRWWWICQRCKVESTFFSSSLSWWHTVHSRPWQCSHPCSQPKQGSPQWHEYVWDCVASGPRTISVHHQRHPPAHAEPHNEGLHLQFHLQRGRGYWHHHQQQWEFGSHPQRHERAAPVGRGARGPGVLADNKQQWGSEKSLCPRLQPGSHDISWKHRASSNQKRWKWMDDCVRVSPWH